MISANLVAVPGGDGSGGYAFLACRFDSVPQPSQGLHGPTHWVGAASAREGKVRER
jgi:hypothetical protein